MSNTKESAPVAILGFGVAGFNSALGLRQAGYAGPIEMFSNIDTLPYSPIMTSYYAGGMNTREECFPWTQDEIAALDLTIHDDSPVLRLDPEAHIVTTSDGDHSYSKCVIATGSKPHCLGFPDCDYDPIVLHSMDDAERLKAVLKNPDVKRVLISGASMVAMKIAEACLKQNKDVTLVGMNPHVLDFNALPAAAERFEQGLRDKGMKLRLGRTIEDVAVVECDSPLGRKLVVGYTTGEPEEFDEIAVAHGMHANLDFVEPGTLDLDRALVVDDFMRTSDPDVYAAGDVVQSRDLISGASRVIGIWKNAAEQGVCAGRAIAAELAGREPDERDRFEGSIASNTIAVDGTLFISAGTIDLHPGRFVEVKEDDEMTVVYIYEDVADGEGRRLVGFNIAADHDEEGSVAYDTGGMLTLRILEHARG